MEIYGLVFFFFLIFKVWNHLVINLWAHNWLMLKSQLKSFLTSSTYLLYDTATSRRSNQSILKEISLEYSLEGLMLKLKLQYFGHLM